MFIRDVLIDDSKELHDLSKQLGYSYSTSLLKENIRRIIRLKNHKIFVIENDYNKVIGYVRAQIYDLIFFDRMVNILGIIVMVLD